MRRFVLAALLGLLPALAWADYVSVVAADHPEHWYYFDESSGTTANDTPSGSGSCSTGAINGTYTGGFTLGQTGLVGAPTHTATRLTASSSGYVEGSAGSSSFVITRGTAGASVANQGASWEIWVKRAAISNAIESLWDSGSNGASYSEWRLFINPSNQATLQTIQGVSSCNTATVYGGTSTTSTLTSTSAWYYIAATVVRDGTGDALAHQKLYFNGSLEQDLTSFSGTGPAICAGTNRIGRMSYNGNGEGYLDGTIAFAGFYNDCNDGSGTGELRAAQVLNHYNAGISTGAKNWPFTVEAPKLPRFMDDGYFAKATRRGYHTGEWSTRTPLPRLIGAFLPFAVMPSGSMRQ